MRRLPELAIVAYDRRGYQGSREAGVVGLEGHIADLVEILTEVRSGGAASVSAIGHSVGGDVVIGAALAEPRAAATSVGAFEPPMPWLGFRRVDGPGDGAAPRGPGPPMAEDPGDEAERFFRRMVSPAAWDRLPEAARADRRADGPALVADLASVRGDPPFDVMDLDRSGACSGGAAPPATAPHRAGVAWLGAHVPGAVVYEIAGAATRRAPVAPRPLRRVHPPCDGTSPLVERVGRRRAYVAESDGPSPTGDSACPGSKRRARRESSRSYSAPDPSPFTPVTRGEWDKKTAPTNIKSSEIASRGPHGPEVRRLSP